MRQWESVLYSVPRSEDLSKALSSAFDELNVSVTEFCLDTDLSESTVYKILSGHRKNVQLENFRQIVVRLRQLEQGPETDQRTIAVITNRESLERVQNTYEIGGRQVRLQGYPSSTVEEAIRQSILAERDGVDAIICGPITAYTIENVIHTPVVGLSVETSQITAAVETALNKI